MILEQDKSLLEDYIRKIESIKIPESLTKLVCDSIDSLLRRQSDLSFAESIKDEYLTRIIDSAFAAQKAYATETITTVIGVRPEIAAAWAKWKQTHDLAHWASWQGDEHRNAQAKLDAPPPVVSLRLDLPSEAESALIKHVSAALQAKAALFNTKTQAIPSMAYCQADGYFLAHPAVQTLLVKMATDGIMVLCANRLMSDILTPMQQSGGDWTPFLQSKNPAILKIIAEHMNAVNQTLHTRRQLDALGPQFKVVEQQQARPKKRSIFGVSFAMGQETIVKQIKVQIDRDSVLTTEEREAIALQNMFDALVAELPISVPAEFSLLFVQYFLELDTAKFDKWVKEITALVSNAKTSKGFLTERLMQLKQQLNPSMAESLLLKLFFTNPERGMRIEQLYDLCLMESEQIGIYGEIYPFIRTELTRRPKELAIQFREAAKTRQSINNVENCLTLLLSLRSTLLAEYDASFEEAAAILNGFKLVLSRDPQAEMLGKLGVLAAEALSAKSQARAEAVKKAVRLYTALRQES